MAREGCRPLSCFCSPLQLQDSVHHGLPPLSIPLSLSAYIVDSKFLVLKEEVSDLLEKQVIVEVFNPDPGFYNSLCLVPKATGGWRTVLDVSSLNNFVRKEKFKMETTRSVLESLREGDWLFSVDMKDAYFHVPIHSSFQRYLKFCFVGRTFQFQALPFGLTSVPLVFTIVLSPFARWLHSLGI